MPPFGRNRFVVVVLPNEDANSKTGPGADYRPRRLRDLAAFLKHRKVAGLQRLDTITHSLEVVDQAHPRDAKPVRQDRGIDVPRQIRQSCALAGTDIDDRPGDSETRAMQGSPRRGTGRAEKLPDHGQQAVVLAAWIVSLREDTASAHADIGNLKQCLGAPDVARQHSHAHTSSTYAYFAPTRGHDPDRGGTDSPAGWPKSPKHHQKNGSPYPDFRRAGERLHYRASSRALHPIVS